MKIKDLQLVFSLSLCVAFFTLAARADPATFSMDADGVLRVAGYEMHYAFYLAPGWSTPYGSISWFKNRDLGAIGGVTNFTFTTKAGSSTYLMDTTFPSNRVMTTVRLIIDLPSYMNTIWFDGKAFKLPAVCTGSSQVTGTKTCQTVSIPLLDGRRATFAGENIRCSVEDPRAYTSPSDKFQFMITVPCQNEGEISRYRQSLVLTIANDVPDGKTYYNWPKGAMYFQDLTFREGNEWMALEVTHATRPGSPLDFSFLADAPAGKYGFVKTAPDGHFTFENAPERRPRFYGGNFSWSAAFLDDADSDSLGDELVRLGYNIVRAHQHDTQFLPKGATLSTEIDPEKMRRFEYFIYAMKRRGIYFTTDCYSSRKFLATDPGLAAYAGEYRTMKKAILIEPAAMDNWKEFSRNLLTHVNPYTGLALKDEPALVALNLINEDNQDDAEAQYAVHQEQIRFLKEDLGVKAPLTSLNMSSGPQYAWRRAPFDVIDQHRYFNHPSTAGKKSYIESSLVSQFSSSAPIPILRGIACQRAYDRPNLMTEFRHLSPNVFRSESGPVMGAYGALQGFDGLLGYGYLESAEAWTNRFHHANIFDSVNDPLDICADRISILMYRRGDVATASRSLCVTVPADARTRTDLPQSYPEAINRMALICKTGVSLGDAPAGTEPIPLAEVDTRLAADLPTNGVYVSETGEIRLDTNKQQLHVSTPLSESLSWSYGEANGRFVSGGKVDASLTVSCHSLDGKQLEDSASMLVFHLTDSAATGEAYRDQRLRMSADTMTRKAPMLVRRGSVRVTFASKRPLRLRALRADGSIAGEILPDNPEGTAFILKNDAFTGGVLSYHLEPSSRVRYVATDGNDTNLGQTPDAPFATIGKAIEDLGKLGGKVYIAKGSYSVTGDMNSLVLSDPISLIGATGDPADVVIKRQSPGNYCRLLKLNHPRAQASGITFSGGYLNTNKLAGAVAFDQQHGGNIYITANGGTVENCILSSGRVYQWAAAGGNAYLEGGRLIRCRLVGGTTNTEKASNEWQQRGGSIFATGGIVENCLITGCTLGGGPVCAAGTAVFANCTIVSNSNSTCGGVTIKKSSKGVTCRVINCAISGTCTTAGASSIHAVFRGSSDHYYPTTDAEAATAFAACAATETINASCIKPNDLRFQDAANGNYSPAEGSPLINAGATYASTGAEATSDLANHPRICGNLVDIGCFEATFVPGTIFSSLDLIVTNGSVRASIALDPSSLTTDLAISVWRDGRVIDSDFLALCRAGSSWSRLYDDPGLYYVSIRGKNSLGDTESLLGPILLSNADSSFRFVAPYGSDVYGGLSPDVPMLTINAAIASLGPNGGRVYLEKGTYAEFTEGVQSAILLTNPVEVVGSSFSCDDVHVIKLNTSAYTSKPARVFRLAHEQAAVRNLTIRGGTIWSTPEAQSLGGANVCMISGSVENCNITDGSNGNWGGAGANVYMEGGRLLGCKLTGGKTYIDGNNVWADQGGSLLVKGGLAESCLITGCKNRTELTKDPKWAGGGPVCVQGSGRLVNCTIAGNAGTYCGGVIIGGDSALVVNCAIFNNTCTNSTAIYKVCRACNRNGIKTTDATAAFDHCAAEVFVNANCLQTTSPCFTDVTSDDYSLQATSPLINAGKFLDTASSIDLAKAFRLIRNKLDIGAYEHQGLLGLSLIFGNQATKPTDLGEIPRRRRGRRCRRCSRC